MEFLDTMVKQLKDDARVLRETKGWKSSSSRSGFMENCRGGEECEREHRSLPSETPKEFFDERGEILRAPRKRDNPEGYIYCGSPWGDDPTKKKTEEPK